VATALILGGVACYIIIIFYNITSNNNNIICGEPNAKKSCMTPPLKFLKIFFLI